MIKVVLFLSVCLWGSVAAQPVEVQRVEALTQNAPAQLAAVSVSAEGVRVEVSATLTHRGREGRIVALALGVVMIDAFNDVIAVNYVRWTDDLAGLEVGENANLSSSFVAPRADDLFLSVPFVYAVRFENGEVWKEDLSHVSTELLSRFEVAASSSTLQP